MKGQEKCKDHELVQCKNAGITEDDLIRLISNRDQWGFGILYNSYRKALLRSINCMISDEEVSKELCHDVFIRIWLNFKQYDRSKGRLYTWMLSIARNICLDHLKSREQKFTRALLPIADHMPAVEYRCSDMERTSLKELLHELQPVQMEVVEMVYFQGFTQHEVAKIKSIPLGTVKTRSRAGLRKLRKRYQMCMQ